MAQAILQDGFVDLCIDDSLNTLGGRCRVLIEGQRITGQGTATDDTLTAVPSSTDAEALFGEGSVLAEAVKKAFCICPNNVEVFALPRADVGTAAVYQIALTGPATADGRMSVWLGDTEYAIDFFIPEGSTAAQIAALIVAEVSADFPYTAAVAGDNVTFTAKNAGIIGNNLTIIENWHGRQNYRPDGVTATVSQTTVGAGTPPPLDLITLLANCCYNCVTTLNDDNDLHEAIRDYLVDAWSCDKPQCFGHGYLWNTGTAAQIIARGTNSRELSRMAWCTGRAGLPWVHVVNYMALSCCSACVSPELSVQGRTRGVLDCAREPQTCDVCFTVAEEAMLRANQFVVSGSLENGTGSFVAPYIYNDVTNNLRDDDNKENITFRSVASRRLAQATAIAVATKLQDFNGLGLFTRNTKVKRGVFGTNPRLMLSDIRAWAKTQVGSLFSEFDNIDEDIQLQTDFDVAIPCTGLPDKMHLRMKYRPPVRIGEIETTLVPEVLRNCDR